MHPSLLLALSLQASQILSAPTGTLNSRANDAAVNWAVGATPDFVIHEFCNTTERTQLKAAFGEVVVLASHALDHILRYGNSSEHYRRYLGDAPSGRVIGWYVIVAKGDRGGALFRCDDIDGNCHQDGWGGHWRGSNATGETVICPLSYDTRHPLTQICALGYTVAGSPTNFLFAGDLLHRLWHMPAFSEDVVSHYTESYGDVIEQAQDAPANSTIDSDALQYFALDVYAYDVAFPGVGCTGDIDAVIASEEAAANSSSASATAPSTDFSAMTITASTNGGGGIYHRSIHVCG